MGRQYSKNRRDENEKPIFDLLRKCGFSVFPLHEPCDALAGFKGMTYLIEVKNGPKAKHTATQTAFYDEWKGSPVVRLNSIDEASSWANQIRWQYPQAESVNIEHRGTIG